MHNEALAKQKTILETPNVKSKPNYTGFHPPERFYIGALGGLALEQIFEKGRCRYKSHERLDGYSDGGKDYTGWIKGKKKRLDIKTSGKRGYRFLMMPTAQYALYRGEVDIYIAARLNRKEDFDVPVSVQFMGVISAREFATSRHVHVVTENRECETREILYENIAHFGELLQIMDCRGLV